MPYIFKTGHDNYLLYISEFNVSENKMCMQVCCFSGGLTFDEGS